MSVRRGHAGRVDGNHADIIAALRKSGIAAESIAQVGCGVPDVVFGFRGLSGLLEIKMPGKALNAVERDWHATWPGHVATVTTPDEAITAVVNHARECGKL